VISNRKEGKKVLDGFHDHATFCRESFRIRNKRGNTVPFELYPAPTRLHALIQKQQQAGKPIRIIVLKARQVFVSAGVAAEFMHTVPFVAGQKAMVVAHDKASAKNIFSYYTQLRDNYTKFRGEVAMPPLQADARAAGVIEWSNGSYVRVETANNLQSGRSYSLRMLHLSEYAFWRNASALMGGLLQSVPDDPDTAVIIESTANGVGGDFHARWLQAMDPTSGSDWIPFFFAWHEHPEYTRPLADRAAFQASLSMEEKDLQGRYHLSLEQLNWRRWCIRNKCKGSVDTFKQEYPSNPEEAFLFSGRPRFSHTHMAQMPVDRNGLAGELVEQQSGPRRILTFQPGDENKGPLIVYKKPAPQKRYAIGVDVSEGIDVGDGGPGDQDPDWSVATVLDCDTGDQVAKLRARMEPAPFAEYVVALARWYNWAFVVPESNGVGIAFIEGLLHHDYPAALIYHRRPQPDEQFRPEASATLTYLGWRQNVVTRPQLLSKLDQAIRDFGVLIRDPNTLSECQTFVYKANGRAEHQDQCHDDEVFALALGVVGIEAAPAARLLAGVDRQTPKAPTRGGTVKHYGRRNRYDPEKWRAA
jgi:hypothetical protein